MIRCPCGEFLLNHDDIKQPYIYVKLDVWHSFYKLLILGMFFYAIMDLMAHHDDVVADFNGLSYGTSYRRKASCMTL